MLNKLQLDQLRSKTFLKVFFQLENEHNGQWHYDSNNEVDQLVSLEFHPVYITDCDSQYIMVNRSPLGRVHSGKA